MNPSSAGKSQYIGIHDVTAVKKYQGRKKLDKSTIDEYCELIQKSNEHWAFDSPCTVYRIDGKLFLTDGFHRYQASKISGKQKIRVIIKDGAHHKALEDALKSNHRHGLRRTNADKRNCVHMALEDEVLGKWSDRKIAVTCDVSHTMVAQMRGDVATVATSPRQSSDGRRVLSASEKNDQKQKIEDELNEYPDASSRAIAAKVGCDHKTVTAVRKKLQQESIVVTNVTFHGEAGTQKIKLDIQQESEDETPACYTEDVVEALSQIVDEADAIQDELSKLLIRIQAIDRTDQRSKSITDSVNKFHAAVCSHLCDMEPIEDLKLKAKSSGVLFADVAEDIASSRRMKPTDTEFDAFYMAFPRRVNRAKSKIAFIKAFRILRKTQDPEESIKTIMQGVKIYAERANPEAMCHPTTWLNGCRWEDDPEAIGSKPASNKKTSIGDYGRFNPEDEELSLEEELRRVLL